MAFSRYARTPRLDLGSQLGTSRAVESIRSAIKDGRLPYEQIVVRGAERLDTLAGSVYGDSRYWWVLAAASDIGWGLQIPVGTVINIPDLSAIAQLVS
jgi:hypothetical protein